ncbi:hypothetical protein OF001_U280017 [Pseudomonas sp. OF001]|nr:hypothetical protein OF001_U280017 [Pseudomonas sp. OF001]
MRTRGHGRSAHATPGTETAGRLPAPHARTALPDRYRRGVP